MFNNYIYNTFFNFNIHDLRLLRYLNSLNNNHIIIFTITLTLILITPRIISFYDLSLHIISYNDRIYYFALADSLLEYGVIKNIIYQPATNALNTHNGHVFLISLFLYISDSYINTTIAIGSLAIILFLTSLPILKTTTYYFNFNNTYFTILITILLLSPTYLYLFLDNTSESLYLPLTIFWFYFLFRWISSDSFNNYTLFFILSFLLLLFRSQTILMFGGLFVFFLIYKDYTRFVKFNISALASALLVLFISYLFNDGITTEAQESHLSLFGSFSSERIAGLLSFFIGFLQIKNPFEQFTYKLIFFIIPIASLFFITIWNNRSVIISNRHYVSTLFILTASFIGLLFFRENILSRYMYHLFPFYIIAFLYPFSLSVKKSYLLPFLSILSLIYVSLIYDYSRNFIFKNVYGSEIQENRIEMIKTVSKKYEKYNPDHIYNADSIVLNRYMYYITRQPNIIMTNTEIKPNSFIVIPSDKSYGDLPDYKKITQDAERIATISPLGEWWIYYKGNN